MRYVGVVMLFIALFMLLSAGISFVSGMDSAFYPLLLASLLTALLGAFPLIFVERTQQITNKEGFCIVVGSWLVACLVGMFPYLIWGGEFSLVNAWFESVSGFTTTGSTILNDIEVLPRGLQFWRMSSTWIGGMGVVMFALLILPSLGRNKMTLSSVELSTLAKDNYRYKTQKILHILLVVYVGLTFVQTVLLRIAGMDWFDAVNNSFSTIATGGFSTKNLSIAYYNNVWIEIIITLFMAVSGLHFGLIFATLTGKGNNVFRSEVSRYYLLSLLVGGLVTAFALWADDTYPTFLMSLRYGLFQIVSVAGHGRLYPSSTMAMAGICLDSLGCLRWVCGRARERRADMNCRYTDEELKEDVERTIGIRAKDIEKIQFCGLWHIRFRAFGTDFYYYRGDSDDTVHLVESPWKWA